MRHPKRQTVVSRPQQKEAPATLAGASLQSPHVAYLLARASLDTSTAETTGKPSQRPQRVYTLLPPDAKKSPKRSAERKGGAEHARPTATDGGTPACHCSISGRKGSAPKVSFHAFKTGIELAFPAKAGKPAIDSKRGEISEFSAKSRLRCAFAFLNAETSWVAMVTLTYPAPVDPDQCRGHLRAWLKRIHRRFGRFDWGWVIEAHKSGRPHFHVFIGDGGLLGQNLPKEASRKVMRHGRPVFLPSGPMGKALADQWQQIIGEHFPNEKEAAGRFNDGGIVELLRTPDAAARYVSKEASKRAQKSGHLGRGAFWRLARHLKPRLRWSGTIDPVKLANLGIYFSRVYDPAEVLALADDDVRLW